MIPLVETAHAAPPEFAADALLRVVESGKVSDKNTRRQLIQDAFGLGGSAQLRAPMNAAAGLGPDTRAASLAKAYQLKLDAMSLQIRAVNAMLALDKPAAREMFSAIAKPALDALPCEPSLAYDPSDFYRTLGAIARATFTPADRKNEDHVRFLLDYVGQAASQPEVAAIRSILPSAGLTSDQLQAIEARLQNTAPGANTCQEAKSAKNEYWQSDAAKQIMQRASELRIRNGAMLSEADRTSSQWQEQLVDLLKTLADWNAGQEKSEADYYHQKSTVYEALIELTPPGPERDKLLDAFAGFIGNSSLQSQSPAEWFVPAKALLERVRNTNTGEPAKVLAAFEASGNAALAVYAALERVFGSQAPSWVTSSKG